MCGAVLPRMPIAYIDVRFFAHATEDAEKVVRAAKQILPPKHADEVVFKRDNLRGHYGNPIVLFETRLKEKGIVKLFVERLSSNLGRLDKETLLREVDLHVGRGDLYIRLDKQWALQGEFRLCGADPIRVRMRFLKNKIEDIVNICRELGLLP